MHDQHPCRCDVCYAARDAELARARLAEREACAELLIARGRQFPGGIERAVYLLAANTVRRGRLLTNAEQMENLRAAINDEPVPHPAPATAQ